MSIRTIEAPAKLNLFLNIVGRREDGYHLLDSLFVFTGLSDRITIEAGNTLSCTISGPFSDGLESDGTNLVLRAAEILREAASIKAGARISLDKQIPVAAGLGGGSADAAAVLNGLNELWGLHWPMERLMPLAGQLGADVPACLPCRPVIARGIGDELSFVADMPECGILLVNPRIATATPAVFKAYRAANPAIPARHIASMPQQCGDLPMLVAAIGQRGNDLVSAAISVTPAIADVLSELRNLPQAAYAGLSGSGATCFALFATQEEAAAAMAAISAGRPGWWSWSGAWARPSRP